MKAAQVFLVANEYHFRPFSKKYSDIAKGSSPRLQCTSVKRCGAKTQNLTVYWVTKIILWPAMSILIHFDRSYLDMVASCSIQVDKGLAANIPEARKTSNISRPQHSAEASSSPIGQYPRICKYSQTAISISGPCGLHTPHHPGPLRRTNPTQLHLSSTLPRHAQNLQPLPSEPESQ